MKKKLIALAVVSTFVSPVFAQSNVTIYGRVDAGIQIDKSAGVSTTTLGSGLYDGSRIGFKGTEDLGSGLKANFVLEHGFTIDNGNHDVANNKAFSRQAWVGLSSEAGEVRLGRQNTPLYDTIFALDPYNTGLAGDASTFLGLGQYQLRADNAITYVSPNYQGLIGTIQYGLGETPGSTSANRVLGLSGAYTNGPIVLNYAYNSQKFNDIAIDSKKNDWILGGIYDFGVAKAHIGYGETKYEDNIAATNDKLKNYLVGVTVPFGNHTFMASWLHSDIKNLDNAKSNMYSVGYTYGLSKRTSLYSSYAYITNEDNVGIRVVNNGDNSSRFNVGINHTF